MEKIPVYAVVGPTASGKSAYAIRLAKELDGEVISGDSMQIYRGMDVGTAKASAEEQQGIPHHLLDVAEITEGFSAGRFMELAAEKIAEIHSRGKTPILCGGTGLYIELLLTGKQLSENTADEKLREELRPQAEYAIRSRAAIDEIVQLEGLEADEEDIAKALAVICRHNGITLEQLKEQYDAGLEQLVINSVLTGKVMRLIRDAAEITTR